MSVRSLLWLGILALLAMTACSGSYQDALDATEDATDLVERTLLGDHWIGDSDYTLLAARQAYSEECDCTVIAARVDIEGEGEQTLFWTSTGRQIGRGIIVGDRDTTRYSDGGDAPGANPQIRAVEDAKETEEGQAVLRAVEGP